MKNRILLLFIFFISQALHSQQFTALGDDKAYIDSIAQVIRFTKSDSLKCISSFRLGDLYRRNKAAQLSERYFKIANSIAPKFVFLRDAAIYYNAPNYINKDGFDGFEKQLVLANNRLKKYKLKEAYTLRAYILRNLSIIEQIRDNEKESMRILIDEAMPVANKGDNYEAISGIYRSLAIIFMNNCMNVFERQKADMYLQKAIWYIERAEKTSYTYQENKAEIYILNAENLCQLEKPAATKASLDNAYRIIQDYPESNINGSFYLAQAAYFYKQNKHEDAIKSFDKGIANGIKHNDIRLINRSKFGKYLPLIALNRYEEAKNLLHSLIDNSHTNISFIEDRRSFNKELALTYEKLGDIKNAYVYITNYMAINDTINKTALRERMAILETKFNKSENEKKIRRLETQREKNILLAKNNKLYYGLLAAIAFILLFLVILLWINSKNQRRLALEYKKNYQHSLTNLKKEKEIEVMQAMIKGEETERKRIARELHDGIGSMLSSLKMRLVKVNERLDAIEAKDVESMNNLLASTINELRQVSYNLIPESLLRLGLEDALIDLCNILKTENVIIDCHLNNIENHIPESAQITIYRIVQELMNNALKHSHSTEVTVDCSQNQNLFFITVEDNGKGFDTSKISNFSGLGLRNLKNRVALFNGKMKVDSSREKGTVFNIELTV